MKVLKYSRQREAIKASLMKRHDHPTADAPIRQHPRGISQHQSRYCLQESQSAGGDGRNP